MMTKADYMEQMRNINNLLEIFHTQNDIESNGNSVFADIDVTAGRTFGKMYEGMTFTPEVRNMIFDALMGVWESLEKTYINEEDNK